MMPETDPAPAPSLTSQIRLAASFLVRLPLPDPGPVEDGALGAAMRAFPLVGLGIGLAAGLVGAMAHWLVPPLAAALVALLAQAVITGALHEDGLADLADGLGARGGRERRLEVMRDSRSGAFGVLALVFSVGLRAAALAAAPGGWSLIGALMAAGALSRALIPAAMQLMGPARPDGLGAGAGVPDATQAATALGIGLVICLVGIGLGGTVAAVLVAGGLVIGVVALARHFLGGYTGDVLGAVQQAGEIGVLLACAMVWP
jgi:adenosylcobinamide-GDP ribazoletransferase